MSQRFVPAVLCALALAAGLVAAPAATAAAPYPGTVATTTQVQGPKVVKVDKSVSVKVSVASRGSGRPDGTVKLSVNGPGGFDKTLRRVYDGSAITFALGKLKKPGKYKVVAQFNGGQTVFRDSKDSTTITAKKPRN